MDYYIDQFDRRTESKSGFWLKFVVFFFVLTAIMFFAYSKGLMPHYTLVIDGNKWEWIRDDAKYLATQSADSSDQFKVDLSIPPKNHVLVAQDKSVDDAQLAAIAETARKIDEQNRNGAATIVEINGIPQHYENLPDIAHTAKPDHQDHAIRTVAPSAYTYPKTVEEPNRPAVSSINIELKRDTSYCKTIESQRDNIRSQQRISSTQWLRDEYDRLSKKWQSECLG